MNKKSSGGLASVPADTDLETKSSYFVPSVLPSPVKFEPIELMFETSKTLVEKKKGVLLRAWTVFGNLRLSVLVILALLVVDLIELPLVEFFWNLFH